MTIPELLNALKRYAVKLSWSVILQKWYVVLWDFDALTFYADDIQQVLTDAWQEVQKVVEVEQ